MKIALAQQNYHIGNFESNTNKIIAAIEEAKKTGAELVVFSELCICGYPPRDLLEFEDFIQKCNAAVEMVKQYSDTIGVIIGSPRRNQCKTGKGLYNAALLLYEKEIKAEVYKTCLPTYDVFDENRHFEASDEWNVVLFKGKKLAITICEDIWNIGPNPLYRICPMDQLIVQQPDMIINISASPFDYTHNEDRRAIIKANVLKWKKMYVYNK